MIRMVLFSVFLNGNQCKEKPVIYEHLKRYAESGARRYHTPGHKGASEFEALFPGASLDITELDFSDNLLCPQGILKEAQELAADCYRVEMCRFVTSGTTVGNQIMMLVAKRLGGRVLLSRASHRSLFAALELFEVPSVFFTEEEEIPALLKANPDIAAVIVTYPDYYGRFCQIEALAQAVHAAGRYLFADGAQGSHLGFHERLPAPLSRCCDLYTLSAHKTLPALTQGSYLMCSSQSLFDSVEECRELLHTTSPSYPIMASLEWAALFMRDSGCERLEQLRRQLAQEDLEFRTVRRIETPDFTRQVFDFSGLKLREPELADFFRKRGIVPEILDVDRSVFLLTAMDGPESVSALMNAVHELDESVPARGNSIFSKWFGKRQDGIFPVCERVCDYLEAVRAPAEWVPFRRAVGRIAARNVGVYPPGVPLLLAGERIGADAADYLQRRQAKLFGNRGNLIRVTAGREGDRI